MDIRAFDDNSPPEMKLVDVKAILAQHRKRYVVHTSRGDFAMRHLRFLDMEEAKAEEQAANKDMVAMLKENDFLAEKAKYVPVMSDEAKAELGRDIKALDKRAQNLGLRFVLRCIERPAIADIVELRAILDSLPTEEVNELWLFATSLTTGSDKDATSEVLLLAKEYGVPLSRDMPTADELTNEQVQLMGNTLRAQEKRLNGGVE